MAFLFILSEPFGLLTGQFIKLGLTMHSETHSSISWERLTETPKRRNNRDQSFRMSCLVLNLRVFLGLIFTRFYCLSA